MKSFLERLLLLKRSSLFGDVPTEDLRVVVQQLREEVFFSGERIFDIGDLGDQMYILVSGKVGIALSSDLHNLDFVTVLGAGECFGEMSLVDDLPRSATAHVVEDAVVLALGKEELRGLVVSYPALAFGLLRSLSQRLRKTSGMVSARASSAKGEG